MESYISDHYLVYSVLNFKLPKPPPTYVTATTYSCYDPDKFVDELTQLSWAWHDNSIFDDINEKLEHFNHNLLEVLNRHSPIKSMRIRYRRCPFIDHEIKELMDARDRLHRCARLTYIWTGKYIACLETKSRTSYVTQRRNIFRMRSTTRRGTQCGNNRELYST